MALLFVPQGSEVVAGGHKLGLSPSGPGAATMLSLLLLSLSRSRETETIDKLR